MKIERIFQILAAALAVAAAYFLWIDDIDWTFACVAVGVCSYFLSMRFQIKERLDARKAEEEASRAEPPV